MVGMNARTAVAGRKSSVFARLRRAGTGGTRAAVLTLGAAMALAGGRAADADIYVGAWGLNTEGQCNMPVFPLANPVAAISGVRDHIIALIVDGDVVCWGKNDWGQCDPPSALGVLRAVDGGGDHTVVLRVDGTVVCWGRDDYGQADTSKGLIGVRSMAHSADMRLCFGALLHS